jgi:type VI secretion system protein ImpJ
MEPRSLARVVWEEGMHLAQHHFQAQNRFFEDSSRFAISSLFFRSYGFVGLELDREALLNGTVSLTHGRGFLPDGLPFHFPHDPPPDPLGLRDLFSPTRPAHVIHLAIPAFRPGAANAAADDDVEAPSRRFLLDEVDRIDEISGEETGQVTVARKNFRLVLDDHLEEMEGMITLPVARVTRDGRGSFTYDPNFIPPVLRIGAVPALGSLLDRVLEMVSARGEGLRAQHGTSPGGEVAEMWLSHAIHQSLPTLRHLRETRGAHPEALYQEMARLAGALCTFALDAHPSDLPLYDHDDLGGCFRALERHLRSRLEVVLPSGSYRIPFLPADPPFRNAQVQDREALHSARFFLSIQGSSSAGELVELTQRLVKVCSAEHIERLVREAFPGLKMTHIPSPPAALRPESGAHYFELEKSGPCWTAIEKSGTLGIYVPDSIPEPEVQLVVLPKE